MISVCSSMHSVKLFVSTASVASYGLSIVLLYYSGSDQKVFRARRVCEPTSESSRICALGIEARWTCLLSVSLIGILPHNPARSIGLVTFHDSQNSHAKPKTLQRAQRRSTVREGGLYSEHPTSHLTTHMPSFCLPSTLAFGSLHYSTCC
jgi:hypothetical protein